MAPRTRDRDDVVSYAANGQQQSTTAQSSQTSPQPTTPYQLLKQEDNAQIARVQREHGVLPAVGLGAKLFTQRQMSKVADWLSPLGSPQKGWQAMTTGAPEINPGPEQAAAQTTGGGAANAAEQTEQQQATAPGRPQPATNPQPAAGFKTETRQIGGAEANVTLNPNNRVTKVVSGDPNSPGPYGMVELVDPNAKARGLPTAEQLAEYQNQQAAMRRYGNIMRPNGESDRDFNANSQVVITPGRGRATNNPGYTFVGGAGDAARFFQPVGRPGGYNPYKQRFRTLFDEQMDARRAARAQPEKPQMDMTLPGNSRRAKYHEQMQAYNNELNQGYGLDAKQMENALQRQRLAQEYGLGMAQQENDNMRTRSALLRDAAAIAQGRQPAQVQQAAPKVFQTTDEDETGGKRTRFFTQGDNGMQELPIVSADAGNQNIEFEGSQYEDFMAAMKKKNKRAYDWIQQSPNPREAALLWIRQSGARV